jgi:exosortase
MTPLMIFKKSENPLKSKILSTDWSILKSRHLGFLFITLVSTGLCAPTLIKLLNSSSNSEYYSHILFLPVISGYLLFARRKSIGQDAQYALRPGMILAATGVVLYGSAWYLQGKTSFNDHATLVMISTLIIWAGGFLALYGKKAIRRAAFPILFLLFMVPLPDTVMEFAVQALRVGSTEVANGIFIITGIPFSRTGFIFQLSTLSIEVARECSGIRSFLALVITCSIAGNLFLRNGWSRAFLILCAIPIAILKNGIRIAVLSLLGAYVDARILESDLHRKGGVLFFVIALLLVGAVILFLKKMEKRNLANS